MEDLGLLPVMRKMRLDENAEQGAAVEPKRNSKLAGEAVAVTKLVALLNNA